MTEIPRTPARHSPHAVRHATFTLRRRGWDPEEVQQFLATLADEIQAADNERAALRAELERLRRERVTDQRGAQSRPSTEVNPHAVALFSQAQQVADRLVAEAVQHARELLANARAQQREILQAAENAAAAAESAARGRVGQRSVQHDAYTTPIPEVEYVRTFARVAQVQLRSVLDALAEQVDKLGEVPRFEARPPQPSDARPPMDARPPLDTRPVLQRDTATAGVLAAPPGQSLWRVPTDARRANTG